MDLERLIEEIDKNKLEVVIGLETHIRLNTKTKLFCTCANQEIEQANKNICSVCTGQMGVLPAVNKEAVSKAIYFGKAVQSSMSNTLICWDRKHYEYPDLPKNFQLTQFQKPIIPDGYIDCFRNDGSTFRVELEQVHIEEDAAKLVHEKNSTLVDFNKGGVPLIEVVTKPCIHNIQDASFYAQYLHRIVQNLKISEANLEKGQFKSDVSVSLRKKGTNVLNPRAEIKNLNSFKFIQEAILEEVTKQLDYYEKNGKPRPDQTTVLFDADLKKTKTMRKKEFAADYRYALEPDIPFVDITEAINQIHVNQKLLPYAIEKTLIEGGVRPQDAKYFTSDPIRSGIFLEINEKIQDPLFVAKTLTNNYKSEHYSQIENVKGVTEIISLFKEQKIPIDLLQNSLKQIIENSDFNYHAYFQENLIPEEKIINSIETVINENKEIAEDIKNGNTGKAGILVGKVLAITGKGVSGKVIREKIIEQLSFDSISKHKEEGREQHDIKNDTSIDSDAHTEQIHSEIILEDTYRTNLITDLSEKKLNENVILSGWVSSIRDHGDLVFIDLRDSSSETFQVRFDRKKFKDIDNIARIHQESVIRVQGIIIQRNKDDYNPGIRTGSIEMDVDELKLLNHSLSLPFEIRRALRTSENVRCKYKYLDHRNAEVKKAIINRHRIIKLIRDILDEKDFLEIETPILSAGSDEGAREFLVPSRNFPGSFYTLPQAPQQFKQILMVGGFDKYFQIARCFRDEDSRGDRQPEFTQLDIEMAFVNMKDIMDLNTSLFNEIVQKIYGNKWKLFPFKILTYYEAMLKYGSDRPDLRFGLEMEDITNIVKETSFQVFSNTIDKGGIVKCIKVDGNLSDKRLSKGQIEKLTQIAESHGLGGLAYIIVNENNLQSPIIKYLGEDIAANIIKTTKAVVGDIVFFAASDFKTANKALDAVRQELGKILKLIKPNELRPGWVIDFPLFEKTAEGNWTFSHNPFSMPRKEDIENHLNGNNIGGVLSQQYDLILNGVEIGGGSIRAHKSEIMEATFRNMGYDKEHMKRSVGHMYDAFQYGAPPHGGIAWGIDRLIMILEKKASIREVIPFPKTGSGEDLLFQAPSEITQDSLNEVHIKLK